MRQTCGYVRARIMYIFAISSNRSTGNFYQIDAKSAECVRESNAINYCCCCYVVLACIEKSSNKLSSIIETGKCKTKQKINKQAKKVEVATIWQYCSMKMSMVIRNCSVRCVLPASTTAYKIYCCRCRHHRHHLCRRRVFCHVCMHITAHCPFQFGILLYYGHCCCCCTAIYVFRYNKNVN